MIRCICLVAAFLPAAAEQSAESAAGKLMQRAWEASNRGDRQQAFLLTAEAERLVQNADPAGAGFLNDVRAVSAMLQRFGFGLRYENLLSASISKSAKIPDTQLSLQGLLLQYLAGEQRWVDCFRIGDEIVARSHQSSPPQDLALMVALQQLVLAAESAGQLAKAESYARASARLQDPVSPPQILIEFLNRHGRTDEARQLMRKQRETKAGIFSRERQVQLHQLQQVGKWAEAIELQKQIVAEADKQSGEDNSSMQISMRQQLIHLYSAAGDLDAARKTWQETLSMAESGLPAPEQRQQLLAYASWLTWRGNQPDEAASILEPLLADETIASGLKLQVYGTMSGIEQRRGNEAKSREWRGKAFELEKELARQQPPPGETIMEIQRKMLDASAARRFEEAVSLAATLMERAPRALDGESFSQAVASVATSMRTARPGEAAKLMDRLVAAAESMASWWAIPLGQALENQTNFHLHAHDWEAARKSAKRWRMYIEETQGPSGRALDRVLQTTAWIEARSGEFEAAMKETEVWLAYQEATSGPESRFMVSSLLQAAAILMQAQDPAQALLCADKAAGMIDRVNPARDPGRVHQRSEAAETLSLLGQHDRAIAIVEQARALSKDLTPLNTSLEGQLERLKSRKSRGE